MTTITPETLRQNLRDYAERFLTPERLERFRHVSSNRLPVLTAAFEDLYDPHNVCAGIRSCEVFGCAEVNVITIENSFSANHGIAVNATRWIDIKRHDSTRGAIDALHERGFTVVGTLPEGEAVPFEDFDLPEKLCLFMGKEHEGMSQEAIEHCDAHVTIPQYGFTQSLNISVALAILLQHFSEAYRRSGREVHLSEDERLALVDGWLERDLMKKFGWN